GCLGRLLWARALLDLLLGLGACDRDGLLDRLAASLALGQCGVRGDPAEPGARDRSVRAALPVREDRRAAAGELLPALAAGERRLGLGLGELGLRLDVHLPAGQAGGEAGVQALLSSCERELCPWCGMTPS